MESGTRHATPFEPFPHCNIWASHNIPSECVPATLVFLTTIVSSSSILEAGTRAPIRATISRSPSRTFESFVTTVMFFLPFSDVNLIPYLTCLLIFLRPKQDHNSNFRTFEPMENPRLNNFSTLHAHRWRRTCIYTTEFFDAFKATVSSSPSS